MMPGILHESLVRQICEQYEAQTHGFPAALRKNLNISREEWKADNWPTIIPDAYLIDEINWIATCFEIEVARLVGGEQYQNYIWLLGLMDFLSWRLELITVDRGGEERMLIQV